MPINLAIASRKDHTTHNMARPSDAQPSFAENPSDEIDDGDDSIILSPDQLQRVAQFREEIRLCQTDLDWYEACVRVRNE
jgi:hypothetical protein